MDLVAGSGVKLRECDSGTDIWAIGTEKDSSEVRPAYHSAAKVGVLQRCPDEASIGEVLAGEVAAGKFIGPQTNPAQIMGLVAGCGIELRERDSSTTEISVEPRSPHRG